MALTEVISGNTQNYYLNRNSSPITSSNRLWCLYWDATASRFKITSCLLTDLTVWTSPVNTGIIGYGNLNFGFCKDKTRDAIHLVYTGSGKKLYHCMITLNSDGSVTTSTIHTVLDLAWDTNSFCNFSVYINKLGFPSAGITGSSVSDTYGLYNFHSTEADGINWYHSFTETVSYYGGSTIKTAATDETEVQIWCNYDVLYYYIVSPEHGTQGTLEGSYYYNDGGVFDLFIDKYEVCHIFYAYGSYPNLYIRHATLDADGNTTFENVCPYIGEFGDYLYFEITYNSLTDSIFITAFDRNFLEPYGGNWLLKRKVDGEWKSTQIWITLPEVLTNNGTNHFVVNERTNDCLYLILNLDSSGMFLDYINYTYSHEGAYPDYYGPNVIIESISRFKIPDNLKSIESYTDFVLPIYTRLIEVISTAHVFKNQDLTKQSNAFFHRDWIPQEAGVWTYDDLTSDATFYRPSKLPDIIYSEDPLITLRRELYRYLTYFSFDENDRLIYGTHNVLDASDELLDNINLDEGKDEMEINGEFENFKIYEILKRNESLFFPCITIDIQRTINSPMFSTNYNEGAEIRIKLMFKKTQNVIKNIDYLSGLGNDDMELGNIELGKEGARYFMEMEELARYYNVILREVLNNFKSDVINMGSMIINSSIMRPEKRTHTLWGVETVVSFDFAGGDKWRK